MQKIEWCGYLMVKNEYFKDIFIRFDRIHERDREMDRQTDRHCTMAVQMTNSDN